MLPVAILAYQRPAEIKKIIETSVTNKIYVSLDFPNIFSRYAKNSQLCVELKLGELYNNYYKIKEIVKNLQSSIKNKEIILLEHGNKNLGIYKHAFVLFDYVFERESSIIIFDDDIIPSEAFFYYANELQYLNYPITGFTESYSSNFNGTFVQCMQNQLWGLVINKKIYEGLKAFCKNIENDSNFQSMLKLFLEKSDKKDLDKWAKIDSNWIAAGRLAKYMDLYVNMFCVINDIRFLKPTVSLVCPSDNHFKYYSHKYEEVKNYSKTISIL